MIALRAEVIYTSELARNLQVAEGGPPAADSASGEVMEVAPPLQFRARNDQLKAR